MDDMQDRLHAQLAAKQQGQTDQEMADMLGCSRVQWYWIRTKKRRISLDMMERATRIWPDLGAYAVADWLAPKEEVA